MRDSWCSKIASKNGTMVSGGAARNVRIAAEGGMDEIIMGAAQWALIQANHSVKKERRVTKKPINDHITVTCSAKRNSQNLLH